MRDGRLKRRRFAVQAVAWGALTCMGAGAQSAMQQKPSAAVPADGASSSALPAMAATGLAGGSGQDGAVAPAKESRVDVGYAQGSLTVDATNASLNQILREVSHKTGIKLTGGVADERVYGHYGPGAPGEILAALLDGTGSNMLLVSHVDGPSELILTRRLGGPTPPNPNAAVNQEPEPQRQDGPNFGLRRPIGMGRAANTMQQPPDQDSAAPAAAPADTAPTANAADAATTDQSPNGTKTPQQIYEQLRKLQQQQADQAAQQPQ